MFKFFVFSDCHGYADELKTALEASGFNPNDENHWLIGCGDYFDRGRQPQEVIDYLMGIKRKILVRGNHEQLLLDMINRHEALPHDIHNGTAQTVWDLAPNTEDFAVACDIAYNKIKDFVDSMVNYVELKEHIFVHSFIPLIVEDFLPAYYTRDRQFSFNPNWRQASISEWKEAAWGNPFQLAEKGLLPNKVLIHGHWHTSYPRAKYLEEQEWGPQADFSIYRGDGYISLDSCVAYSGYINVLTIEDTFLEE